MNSAGLKMHVVDDDEAVRRALGLLLLSRGHAVQTFACGEDFLAQADVALPGCAILDLRMGGISGLQVFDTLRERASPLVVIFLSGHGDIPNAVQAVQSGAFGWIEKPCSDATLLDQIDKALTLARTRAGQQRSDSDARARWQRLTDRERQVAPLVAQGLANKVIARELVPTCGPRSVETYRANVFAKLQLANSHELDRFMREHGLPGDGDGVGARLTPQRMAAKG